MIIHCENCICTYEYKEDGKNLKFLNLNKFEFNMTFSLTNIQIYAHNYSDFIFKMSVNIFSTWSLYKMYTQ